MSTIMNALRKIEDQKTAAARAADPGELDRKILESSGPERSNSTKRVALSIAAVFASGIAGVGITLAALSYWQSSPLDASAGSESTSVSAAPLHLIAGADPASGGERSLVITTELIGDANSDFEEVVVVDVFDEASAIEQDETSPASPPAATRDTRDPEASARLQARREARLSRASFAPVAAAKVPRESETAAPKSEEQSPTRAAVIAAPGSSISAQAKPRRTDTTAPVQELAQAAPREAKRAQSSIAQHQRAETLAIEAELEELLATDRKTGILRTTEAGVATGPNSESSPREVIEAGAFERAVNEDAVDATNDRRATHGAALDAEPARASARGDAPRFAINRTTWHPHRKRRTAEISVDEAGRTRVVEVREGQMLGPMKVTEIDPTGVTFTREGKETRRRIGSEFR